MDAIRARLDAPPPLFVKETKARWCCTKHRRVVRKAWLAWKKDKQFGFESNVREGLERKSNEVLGGVLTAEDYAEVIEEAMGSIEDPMLRLPRESAMGSVAERALEAAWDDSMENGVDEVVWERWLAGMVRERLMIEERARCIPPREDGDYE